MAWRFPAWWLLAVGLAIRFAGSVLDIPTRSNVALILSWSLGMTGVAVTLFALALLLWRGVARLTGHAPAR
jgi:hypothetical protein